MLDIPKSLFKLTTGNLLGFTRVIYIKGEDGNILIITGQVNKAFLIRVLGSHMQYKVVGKKSGTLSEKNIDPKSFVGNIH